jgi:hypothetical protein
MCGALANVGYGRKADITLSRRRPVISTGAIASGGLIYQLGEAATKLNIKNLVDAVGVYAFIEHQRVKLAFY